MVQSPSWEANWFAASQEIIRISRNPKVHYRTHKRPPPVSILGQPNPIHIPTSHPLEIRPNIIHPSTPRSPQWSPSLRFPQKDPIQPLCSPMRATCPARLILLAVYAYTGCPRRNVPDFGRVFLMLKYTDINQNTYVQSWTVTEIMASEDWNFDSRYTLIGYQIHIKTGSNMWFL